MEKKLLFHYVAETMNFVETFKQNPIAEFEAWYKYHGSKCEYNKMVDTETKLIRDRFVSSIYNDKLRAEQHAA